MQRFNVLNQGSQTYSLRAKTGPFTPAYFVNLENKKYIYNHSMFRIFLEKLYLIDYKKIINI